MEPDEAVAPGAANVRPATVGAGVPADQAQPDCARAALAARSASGLGKKDLDTLWNISKMVTDDTRLADTKAGTIILLSSGLIAALYSTKLHVEIFTIPLGQWGLVHYLGAGAFVLLGAGVLLAVWAIKPRLRATHTKGFIFWRSIRGFASATDFWRAFRDLDEEGLIDHVARRLYLMAGVCAQKFFLVTLSMWAAVLGALAGTVAVMLRDVLQHVGRAQP